MNEYIKFLQRLYETGSRKDTINLMTVLSIIDAAKMDPLPEWTAEQYEAWEECCKAERVLLTALVKSALKEMPLVVPKVK